MYSSPMCFKMKQITVSNDYKMTVQCHLLVLAQLLPHNDCGKWLRCHWLVSDCQQHGHGHGTHHTQPSSAHSAMAVCDHHHCCWHGIHCDHGSLNVSTNYFCINTATQFSSVEMRWDQFIWHIILVACCMYVDRCPLDVSVSVTSEYCWPCSRLVHWRPVQRAAAVKTLTEWCIGMSQTRMSQFQPFTYYWPCWQLKPSHVIAGPKQMR